MTGSRSTSESRTVIMELRGRGTFSGETSPSLRAATSAMMRVWQVVTRQIRRSEVRNSRKRRKGKRVSPCGSVDCSKFSKDQKRDCSQGSPATVRGNSNSDSDNDNGNGNNLKERRGVGEEERGTSAGSTGTDKTGSRMVVP